MESGSALTNMHIFQRVADLQVMHVSGYKTQKTFMDYIELSSEEISDELKIIEDL